MLEKLLNNIENQEQKINSSKVFLDEAKQVKKGLQARTKNQPKPIEWETDIDKIDISLLRNAEDMVRGADFARVDKINLLTEGVDFLTKQDTVSLDEVLSIGYYRHLELIGLIQKGVKLIPPIYTEVITCIDGEYIRGEKQFVDGSHRQRIARVWGLDEVPVLVYERLGKYLFTPGKWDFETRDILIEKTEIRTRYIRHIVAKSKDDETEVIIKNGGRIEENNKEYIEINVGF